MSRFRERTKRSRHHDNNAKKYLPGGDTRTTTYFEPYPVYMHKGRACFIYDVDGNRYLDFVNNYTSLIHGHAHPQTVEAAQNQLERGSILGAAAEIQYVHAKRLIQRMPFLETVRYCNSGTEATLFAIRAARAFSGKDGIIKMDGGYRRISRYRRSESQSRHKRPTLFPGSMSIRALRQASWRDVHCRSFQ